MFDAHIKRTSGNTLDCFLLTEQKQTQFSGEMGSTFGVNLAKRSFVWQGFGHELIKALFTSRVFEGMGGNYFDSQNFPDRLFTSPGFEEIIPGYPHKSPSL
jgi:hypothetical protein